MRQDQIVSILVPGPFGRETEPPKVDMRALETDHSLRRKLATVGLDPICDWLAYGCQTQPIPGSIVVACASMFSKYLKELPSKETHLKGTPYSDSRRIEDNMDHNGCIEYKDELEPAFRDTARLGKITSMRSTALLARAHASCTPAKQLYVCSPCILMLQACQGY